MLCHSLLGVLIVCEYLNHLLVEEEARAIRELADISYLQVVRQFSLDSVFDRKGCNIVRVLLQDSGRHGSTWARA